MTTLLPPQEVDALRSLKATAFLLAVMIRLDAHYPGRAFRPEQIAPIVEMDVRTVAKHLRSLSARNRVLLTSTGYVLTENGRAMFLPARLFHEAQDQAQENQVLAPSPGYPNQAQALEADIVSGAPENTHNVRALEEESSTDSESREDSSSDSGTHVVRADVRALLDATGALFDKPVQRPPDVDQLDAAVVLGWIAQAYDQRCTDRNPRGLYAPWGLVYKRLLEGAQPQTKYYWRPQEFLPAAFLQAIGLLPAAPCESSPPEPEEISVSVETADPPAEAHPQGEIDPELAKSWEYVKAQLRADMPKASFDTWVQDTWVLDFQEPIFTVGVRNSFAQAWLQDRLASTCRRLLTGILDAQVQVRFEVRP